MSRISIFPPVATVYPNDRQLFTARAVPSPAMWHSVSNSGDIKSDFSLEVDGAQSQTTGGGAHTLRSGIGIVEITIDDQCRPTSSGRLNLNCSIFDVNNFVYFYGLNIDATAIEVRDELNNQIYSEAYSTVSGDVYRVELNAGFRLYRNGVLKHSRVGLATVVVYPMGYQSTIIETTATAPTRIPPPRLIGDWQLGPVVTFTAPSHGSITTTGPNTKTEYFGGTTPGVYTLVGAIDAANDASSVQRATATINIPALQNLGAATVTLQPGQKVRFKTNYDAAQTALITWSVVAGGGSFTQGEYTASTDPGTSVVRAFSDVNDQVADITVIVPVTITNPNNYTAAKASEEIDFATNIPLKPSFVSAGAVGGGTAGGTPGLPPGLQVGDIMLLFCETANEAVSTPSGWAIVADSPQGTGTAGGTTSTRLSVFWKRATATEVAPPIADPGDHVIARILAFRNCIDTGNPWDVTSGDTGASSTSVTIPGDTTTVANCLVVLAVANATDTLTFQTSGYTNTDLTNLTEVSDLNTDQGNGGGFAVATGEKAVAGSYGATTATLATASVQGRMSIALKPAVPTWSASAGSINSSTGIWTAPSLTGQTARITVTNGTLSLTLEVEVLDVFPFEPSAPLKWERRKTVLVSTAEDRTRTSRVKDKLGLAFESHEVSFVNLELSELDTILAFWDAHFPGKKFIIDDNLRDERLVVYFDSNISAEAASDCSCNISFRVVAA